jgi:hypothetical protein
MSRWLLSFPTFLLLAALPGMAQSSGSVPPSADTSAQTVKPEANSSAVPAPTSKKVWTNENVRDANGSVSVVGDPRNQKYPLTPGKADAGTATRIRQNLEKLQKQLADVNKQLATYKQFLDGEAVSQGARDMSRGYSRTPVDQQMTKLQEKKKDLQEQIDALIDEARKKGVEPGQLR